MNRSIVAQGCKWAGSQGSWTLLAGVFVTAITVLAAAIGLAIFDDVAGGVSSNPQLAAQQPSEAAASVAAAALEANDHQTIANPFDALGNFTDFETVATGISPETLAKAQWKRLLPQIQAMREQRRTVFQEEAAIAVEWLQSLRSAASFEAFIDQAQSLFTITRLAFNPEDEFDRLMVCFESEVFSEGLVQEFLEERATSLHLRLTELDNAGLVALAIDSPLDTSSLAVPEFDVSSLVYSTDGLADELKGRLGEIIAQKLAATAGSFIVGATVEQNARDYLAYDEYGNWSILGELEAALWGYGAGKLAEVTTSYIWDAEKSLRSALAAGVDDIYARLLAPQASWRSSFSTVVALHDEVFLECVIDQVGVDRDWALSQLQ